MAQPIIDIHAHILEEETVALLQKEAPRGAPKLTPIGADFAVLEVGGTPYKPFPRGAWDLDVAETAKATVLGGAAAKLLGLDLPAPARAADQA